MLSYADASKSSGVCAIASICCCSSFRGASFSRLSRRRAQTPETVHSDANVLYQFAPGFVLSKALPSFVILKITTPRGVE